MACASPRKAGSSSALEGISSRDVSPAHGGTSPRPPASPKVHENSRVSAALRTVYSSLQALQRHKSNVSSPATGSPASSTASPPSSTAALTASTNVVTSNLAGTANTTAGNFSTPGAAVKDALWMHKRNEHLESEVARLRGHLREVLRESERDAEALDRLQAERAAMEDDARVSSSAKVAHVQVQNLQLNSLLVENAELLTQQETLRRDARESQQAAEASAVRNERLTLQLLLAHTAVAQFRHSGRADHAVASAVHASTAELLREAASDHHDHLHLRANPVFSASPGERTHADDNGVPTCTAEGVEPRDSPHQRRPRFAESAGAAAVARAERDEARAAYEAAHAELDAVRRRAEAAESRIAQLDGEVCVLRLRVPSSL